MTLKQIRVIAAVTTIALISLLALQAHWLRGSYRDARATFDRRVDMLLSSTSQRVDPGDDISQRIAAVMERPNADSLAVRAAFTALRHRIDLDLVNAQLPPRYTIVLARVTEPAMHWTDPASRDTAGLRAIQLRRVCATCVVQLGIVFDDVGPPTFLSQIGGIVAISILLVGALVICVVLTFNGLARARRQLEQQIDFVNNLAHELRTPLFSISVAGKVLAQADSVKADVELSRQVALIARARERLSKHSERLLDLAALQAGPAQEVHSRVNLNDVVRHAMAGLEPAREVAHATVQLELAEVDVVVDGNADRLEQAVANLLDNAFKYGGSPATVVVRTKRDADVCKIEVQDNGGGIPPQHRAEIFAPFFRIANGARHDVKGFGLGLAHVKAVAAAHRGTVTVSDTQAPNGALFVLTFPARPTT